MQKNETPLYWGMLGLSLAFSILAVITLLPNPAASKPNVLGYFSVCSFAPAATALCGLLAGITCTLRNRVASAGAASQRYRPFIVPGAVGVLLIALALIFGVRFGNAQARFGTIIAKTRAESGAGLAAATVVDGTHSATVSEGEVSATVEVTVSAGQIQSMRLTAGKNVGKALAAEIFSRIRKAATTDVDAVSGATASSNVLLKDRKSTRLNSSHNV
jgi:uncharacterized protein with FMN-binding domain